MDSFSPEHAARLHNKLLHIAIEHDPSITTEKTLPIRILQSAHADEQQQLGDTNDEIQQHPVHKFLSLLETTSTPIGQGPGLFTPVLYQPDPCTFWDKDEFHPGYVLLYSQNNADSPFDGGVYMNLATFRVIWRNMPLSFAEDQEIPIETFYKILLGIWKSGKYHYSRSEQRISVRWWRDSDLEEALICWKKLLSAIENRLPHESQQNLCRRLPPLESKTLQNFKLGRFAKEWLSQAERPAFKYIAPGLFTFTPETYLQIYSTEPADSYRQDPKNCDPKEHMSSLLFPSDCTVPKNVSSSMNREIRRFEQGASKFTVARAAGLYTESLEPDDADVVRLIHPSGLCKLLYYRPPFPWDQGRGPRLAEVLRKWAYLVESGIWDVDANGVATSIDWFTNHSSEAKPHWREVLEELVAIGEAW